MFFHSNDNKTNYKGTYVETDTDYTLFLDNPLTSGTGMVMTKFDNDSIAAPPDYSVIFIHQKGSFLNRLGL
jgi:hypothetical protein